MIDVRRLVRRLVTWTVLGAVYVPAIIGIASVTSRNDVNLGEMRFGAGIGALHYLLFGIASVIENKPARRRFILGLAAGYVFGIAFTFAVATGSRLPVILGPLAGALIGGGLAIARVRASSDNP